MYIRYRVSDGIVVYVGNRQPINVEDGTYAVVQLASVPKINISKEYFTYENDQLVVNERVIVKK